MSRIYNVKFIKFKKLNIFEHCYFFGMLLAIKDYEGICTIWVA